MWNGMEKRKFPRANFPCHIRLRRQARKGILRKKILEEFSTHTENIGIGGICVVLARKLTLFAPVEVDIELGDKESLISTQGTVVWVVKRMDLGGRPQFDIGIEFKDLNDADRARIENIVQQTLGDKP